MIRQLGGLPRTREADCFHPEKDSLDWGLDAVFASPKHFLKRTLRISLSTMCLGHFSPMSNESELSVFCPLLALKSWEKNRPHAIGSLGLFPTYGLIYLQFANEDRCESGSAKLYLQTMNV